MIRVRESVVTIEKPVEMKLARALRLPRPDHRSARLLTGRQQAGIAEARDDVAVEILGLADADTSSSNPIAAIASS